MEKIEITIVGAGVVGLAVAFELSRGCKDVYVVEKESSFGQGISSRNSEVIHAGIYYPKDSLKARTCIEGRRLLYSFCAKNQVAHRRIGKLIVALNDSEEQDLEGLLSGGRESGVDDLRLLSKGQIKELEPNICAQAAIFSPSTGIVDSHSLMKTFVSAVVANGGSAVYNTEVTAIDKVQSGFEVTVKDKSGEAFKFLTRILINCAGLTSDKVSALAGLSIEEYRIKYCKGDYMRVHSGKAKFINRLVYPVPKRAGAGLGIHATLDLAGGLRLGPDDAYVQSINYDIDPLKAKVFYESVRDFLPFIDLADINPDTSGIRPKLQGPGEAFRDFIINDEIKNGLPGFINLVGIESPGLTAALSIAKKIKCMLQ